MRLGINKHRQTLATLAFLAASAASSSLSFASLNASMSDRFAYFLPWNSSCFAFLFRSISALMASISAPHAGLVPNGEGETRRAGCGALSSTFSSSVLSSFLVCSPSPHASRIARELTLQTVPESSLSGSIVMADRRDGDGGPWEQPETDEERRKREEEEELERSAYLRHVRSVLYYVGSIRLYTW